MNFTRLLNQVLSTVQKKGNTFSDSPLNSFGGGALVAGVASMLLNGKNRKTITKIGSTAALGYLAYRGYQMWQQNKGRATVTQSDFQPAGETEETYSRTVLRTRAAASSTNTSSGSTTEPMPSEHPFSDGISTPNPKETMND
ncbi:DUF533 domain-containing protein, partial [Neisseria meningitidis]|uniref:DUF533 domain-containing protein n=1 Tax=Neisseria meningitidis TaxID=487 RepID=UPI00032EDB7B